MTSMKRRVTSVLVAAATVMCLGTAAVQGGNAVIGDLGIKASAAAGVGYINSTGDYKTVSAYSTITSSSTKLMRKALIRFAATWTRSTAT